MAGETTKKVLAALEATRAKALCDGIERAGAFLESGKPAVKNDARIGRRLLKLAGHDGWMVRRAVARAILHLRHEAYFERAMALLEADADSRVKAVASRTRERRRESDRTEALRLHPGDLLKHALAGIGDADSERDALRVAYRFAETLLEKTRHSVRNALPTIKAAHEAIRRKHLGHDAKDDGCVEHVDLAQRQLEDIERIFDALRPMTREPDFDFRDQPLARILADAMEQARYKHGHEVDAEIDVGDLEVHGDRSRLVEAFSNLFENAIESCAGREACAPIYVSATRKGPDRIGLSIRDDGCGIPRDMVSEVFDPFVSTKMRGSGMGLTIARQIIMHEHRGTIRLEGEEGKGTTVWITLPAAQDAGS